MSGAPTAFDLLHPRVQRWIWRQGWQELRDIQERSIPVLLAGDRDAIIAAATASGKTEAAFLPIVSRLAWRAEEARNVGVGALYVSPLRALINDQFRRVEGLCEELDLPVFRWHSDVASSEKARARRARAGVILITPESLEALLARRGAGAGSMLRGLAYVVIDELHAFLDQARGRHLRSLLHRLERAIGRRAARVGLSATLADLRAAAAFLRPGEADRVAILESRGAPLDLKLQLRGYVGSGDALPAIATHLFGTLRGGRSLIFAGSRSRVEELSATLARLCEEAGAALEFFPHHGSLSREWREDAESRMRDEARPSSIVCTTTLELGIDVGAIGSVAQIGPGHTVAGMRQRLGRSGRRPGQPAVFRLYVAEPALGVRSHPTDALRTQTVQTIAMVELLLARWMEPPLPGALHLSTLLHQILALISQHGGVTPSRAHAELVGSGVFAEVPPEVFRRLLRRMGEVGLLEQAPDGTLLLGQEGERVAARHDFFAVFHTPEEYRIAHAGTPLATVPVECLPRVDDLIVVAGRYWRVETIDAGRRDIAVQPAAGGEAPWAGVGAGPDDGVVRRMRELYRSPDVPRYLDPAAAELLREGRASFVELGLDRRGIVERGKRVLIFPWVGGRRQEALTLALLREGLRATPHGIAVSVEAPANELASALRRIAGHGTPEPTELASLAQERALDKFDRYLDEELLCRNYASRMIDVTGLPELADSLVWARPWTRSPAS